MVLLPGNKEVCGRFWNNRWGLCLLKFLKNQLEITNVRFLLHLKQRLRIKGLTPSFEDNFFWKENSRQITTVSWPPEGFAYPHRPSPSRLKTKSAPPPILLTRTSSVWAQDLSAKFNRAFLFGRPLVIPFANLLPIYLSLSYSTFISKNDINKYNICLLLR